MCSRVFFLLVFCFSFISYSQIAPNHYFVQFADKTGSNYSVSNPSQFLSHRSIARRNRQGISIVEQDLPVSDEYLDEIKNCGDFTILYTSKWLNGAVIQLTDTIILNCISQLPFVASTSNKNGFRIKTSTLDNNDTIFHECHSESSYGESLAQLSEVNLLPLHKLGYTGEGIHVAVFDNGFKGISNLSAFQSLLAQNRIQEFDIVKDDSTHFYKYSHGTNVFSIIAGNARGEYIGAAIDSEFFLFRTENGRYEYEIEEYNWLRASEMADSMGIDVINSSLSYVKFDNSNQDHFYEDANGNTTVISKAAKWVSDRGIVVVCSAGNYGNGSWKKVGFPADTEEVLTVGSVKKDSIRSNFSSMGPTVDGRIKPDIVARGQETILFNTNGKITSGNGTSFSAPIITGAVACLWQSMRYKTSKEIIQLVKESASQYNNPDTLLGYGIPNFGEIVDESDSKNIQFNSDYFTVFPNPFSNATAIMFYAKTAKEIKILVSDLSGKLHAEKSVHVCEGRNAIPIELNYGQRGVYLIRVITNNRALVKRVISQ